MNIKILTTTLVSMSLLSMNLFASGAMKCTGDYCMVKIEKPSSKTPKIEKIEIKGDIVEYQTIVVNNIETILLPHSKFVMSEDEIAEYELNEMQKSLIAPALSSDLPLSDFLCEDDLKPIKVAGIENTYECS